MQRKIDWPVVVLIGLVLAAAIAALRVLGVEKSDLAAISAEQWLVIASVVGGAAGTLVAAFREKVVRIPMASTSTSPATRPPPGPLGVLFVAAAISSTTSACGAGALSAHARASSILVVALEGADELADSGAELAVAACHDVECTEAVEHATAAIDAAIASTSLPVAAYVEGVRLALAGGEDLDVLQALAVVLARVLLAWNDLVPLYEPLGVELPRLPESIAALARLLAPGDPS